MKRFFIILLFSLATCDTKLETIIFKQFQKFITKYKKNYQSINDYLARYEVFKRNIIDSISNEEASYKTGITQFSDLTKQEFKKIYLNLKYDAMAMSNFNPTFVKISNAAPASYDWRNYNRVSPVKDQGSCGSCWAFSTVGNLEGLYAGTKGRIKEFSEQQLIDCDTSDSGCNGGLMEYAYIYLKNADCLMFEEDYPYKGYKDTCKIDKTKCADISITGFKKLGSSYSTWSAVDEDEIRDFLYETGPLSIALNADPLQTYTSGILDLPSSKCPTSGINHGVLLVGYGTASGVDYWIIKNSWGKSWGESGYFRIRRGNGTCGVNCYITTATISF